MKLLMAGALALTLLLPKVASARDGIMAPRASDALEKYVSPGTREAIVTIRVINSPV